MFSRFLLAGLALALAAPALAVPYEMAHQGRLFDSSGTPLTGANSISFSLFDAPNGGSPLWSESQSLTFDNGYFSAVLGQTSPFTPEDFGDTDTLYLALSVNGGAALPGRIKLTSAPWALWADTATNVSGGVVDASEIRINGSVVIDGNGVSWNDLSDVPSDFSDGTDDGLVAPSCSAGAILEFDGSSWSCANANAHEHSADAITSGRVALERLPVGSDGSSIAAGDHGHNGVEALSCSSDQIPLFDGSAWSCIGANAHTHDAAAITGTFSVDQLPVGTDGNTVAAGNHAHNGLEALDCDNGEAPVFEDDAWSCAPASAGGGGGSLLFNFELNENSGTSFTDSASGHIARATSGGIAAGSQGHSGRGINFSGGVITVESGNGVSDSPYITAEAWIEPALPLSGTRVIAMKEGAWALTQENSNIKFALSGAEGDCEVTSYDAVTAGQWSQVSGLYNGRVLSVAINGNWNEVDCEEGPVKTSAGSPIHIGADGGNSNANPYKGTIDEIRLWGYAPLTDSYTGAPILQTRVYSDYTRRATGDGGRYYFGGSETSNAITPRRRDSIIQIDIDYFGESTNHNNHVRLEYRIGNGSWTSFDLVGNGQQGHMKTGHYPDTDYNSTPHNSHARLVKAFNTTEPIYFRTYHFNGGTFYHNNSVSTSYETGPSTLTLTELNAAHSSYTKR